MFYEIFVVFSEDLRFKYISSHLNFQHCNYKNCAYSFNKESSKHCFKIFQNQLFSIFCCLLRISEPLKTFYLILIFKILTIRSVSALLMKNLPSTVLKMNGLYCVYKFHANYLM